MHLSMRVLVSAVVLVVAGCQGDKAESPVEGSMEASHDGTKRPAPDPDTVVLFNFGTETAIAVRDPLGIRTTLQDAAGETLATLRWVAQSDSVELDVPNTSHISGALAVGTSPLRLKGTTFALYYYWTHVQAALGNPRFPEFESPDKDNPGCCWFPDSWETPCILQCCAVHDACYAAFDCSVFSWLGLEGSACSACNINVVGCIGGQIFVSPTTTYQIAEGEQSSVAKIYKPGPGGCN